MMFHDSPIPLLRRREYRMPLIRSIVLVAIFSTAAAAQAPVVTAAQAALASHPWQLVGFRGKDGRIFNPDDRTKYTLTFEPAGALTVRLDCNRGRGTWSSPHRGRLQFSAVVMTQASCGPESLADRIVEQWTAVHTYAVRHGNLVLSLVGHGGTFEFEPARASPR
jgi:heat shock protein HslJ